MVYPVVLWLVGFGGYLTASHPAEAPEQASSLAGTGSTTVSQSKGLVSSSW